MMNYTKTCTVCGVKFLSVVHNRKYCSDRCRNIALKKKYPPKNKYCNGCGKKLPDGRQQWCFDCLLNDYSKVQSGIAYKRLSNRGYDKELIREELKIRGWL